MSNWKGYGNSFDSWFDKKRYCYIKWVIFENKLSVVKIKQNFNQIGLIMCKNLT